MNILIIFAAILAYISLSESIDKSRLDKSCLSSTDFRKLSHCITKRQTRNQTKPTCPFANNGQRCPLTNNVQRCPFSNNSGRSCDDCATSCNNCDTPCNTGCNSCEQQPRTNKETNTNTKNDNNINVQQGSSNKNDQDSKIHVNLVNTVHNYNNISNPITITNVNHFFYNGSVTKSSKCENGQSCEKQTEIAERPRITPCGRNVIRPPIVLPPYIPPPSPCFAQKQFPFIGCNQQPAPYITSNCASCFYCGGQYNPGHCSQQPTCMSGCRNLQCAGGPCYPQLSPCS